MVVDGIAVGTARVLLVLRYARISPWQRPIAACG